MHYMLNIDTSSFSAMFSFYFSACCMHHLRLNPHEKNNSPVCSNKKRLMSAGMRIAPIAKVVATELPLIAAKIMQVTMQVAGSPPWMPPTIDFAN